jgi:hypothetical protein
MCTVSARSSVAWTAEAALQQRRWKTGLQQSSAQGWTGTAAVAAAGQQVEQDNNSSSSSCCTGYCRHLLMLSSNSSSSGFSVMLVLFLKSSTGSVQRGQMFVS